MRARWSAVPGVLVAVVLAVVTAGCGGAGGTAGAVPLGPLPTIRTQSDLVLPLDHYLPTPYERAVLATAQSELVARCMARLGFRGYPVDSWKARLSVPVAGNTFGVFTEENARTYAYKASFGDALLREQADRDKRFAAWTAPAVSTALDGGGGDLPRADLEGARSTAAAAVPRGGCNADARRELYGFVGAQAPPSVAWIDQLVAQAFGSAAADPRLTARTEAWSACMKAAGYAYRTPDDANNDVRWDSGADPEGARRAALTDVHCKWSSRYLDTLVALTAAYQDQLVEANAERLRDLRDTRVRLLAAVAAHGLGRIRDYGQP